MEKEWIPVVAALLGVLVGGIITSFVKFLELNYQQSQARLAKLELAYESVLEFQKASFEYFSSVNRLASEVVSPEQIHETTVGLINPTQKINTLVSFYCPHLYPLVVKLTASTVQFQHYGLSILEGNENDLNKLRELYKLIADIGAELLENIQEQSTTYTGAKKITLFHSEIKKQSLKK